MYKKFKSISTFILGILVAGAFQSASAEWNETAGGISAADAQDIVITMKVNPRRNLEQACLAITFARSLSAKPNANITLFVTLDGVALAKEKVINKRRLKCVTPWGEISLQKSLEAFLKGNSNNEDNEGNLINQNAMVVCPICWDERYGDDLPDYGVLPISSDTTDVDGSDHIVSNKGIGTMMFNADKILGF